MSKSKIWFTADTHFGQKRTLELSRRPFKSVADMDMTLFVNWENTVGHNDVVVHLGDFGDPWYVEEGERTSLITLLPGRAIYFLPGNYDTPEVLAVLKQDPRVVITTPPNNSLSLILAHAGLKPHPHTLVIGLGNK